MAALSLHDLHASRGATFTQIGDAEAVANYGSSEKEYEALTQRAGLLDLGFRGRICVIGSDREKFLHGQVTNDVLRLKGGEGCYAAVVSGKGKLETDLFLYKLNEEILLDFEPGLSTRLAERLNKYIIADDVQVIDVSADYGLLSVSGPFARVVLQGTGSRFPTPEKMLGWLSATTEQGEIYVSHNPRFGIAGYDLFVPVGALEQVAAELETSGRAVDAAWAGTEAAEMVRIENGIPRFGVDMNDTNLPQEAEIQDRAVSFAKGCYIGQEIIARIRTYGQVAKARRFLRITGENVDVRNLPGTKLFSGGKEVGMVTSATYSPREKGSVGMGYVRKEVNAVGTVLELGGGAALKAQIVPFPGKG